MSQGKSKPKRMKCRICGETDDARREEREAYEIYKADAKRKGGW